MIYRSKAPLRIGLAGGGTDVSPFSDMYGGAILNATLNLYAYASLTPRNDDTIVFHAYDRKERLELKAETALTPNGILDLQKGVYNRIVKDYTKKPFGFELITHIDAPSGSGLGTSSTLVVAMIGAFVEWLNLPLGEYDIARLAYSIEREDLGLAGGKQDQYAATFGGVNFMEFLADDKVIVNPLRIKTEVLHELEFHLLLYYTQTSRESSNIIEVQRKNVEDNKSSSVEATKLLKEQAFMMKETLLKGDLNKIGEILDIGWMQKKKMADGISNSYIDTIYDSAKAAGSSGGKISGAGGGGFMIFYCPGNTKYQVMEALDKLGGTMQRYSFVQSGMVTWTTNQ